jgi:hypothetical protein
VAPASEVEWPGNGILLQDLKRKGLVRSRLRGAAPRVQRHIPHLSENARHLHPVEFVKERHHLRDERVFDQLPNLLVSVSFAARQQVRHGDAERLRQPFERGKRWTSLLVLDLRDIRPRHGHARGQLPLAHPAAEAERANGGREPQVAWNVLQGRDQRRHGGDRRKYLLIFIERSVAPAA